METIGDFGEMFIDKKPDRDICAFGEDCAGTVLETHLRICAFGEDCAEDLSGQGGIGTFGERADDRPFAEDICAFGEPCAATGSAEPEQRICAFGEECPPSK